MKVFEGVEIEFFDMTDVRNRPNPGEEVIIVLKEETTGNRGWYQNPVVPTGKQKLTYAEYKVYATVPAKFTDKTGYYTKNFKLEDILCWGRLKSN